MLRKEKNFKNFLNDKIVNLSDSSKESIIYSNRIFGEFCQEEHDKTLDKVSEDELLNAIKYLITEKILAVT